VLAAGNLGVDASSPLRLGLGKWYVFHFFLELEHDLDVCFVDFVPLL
jgi:hypothetical protein